jgi:hypothetical protein
MIKDCCCGRELLQDLQRAEYLSAWNEAGVRSVLNEIIDMVQKIQQLSTEFEETSYLDTPSTQRAATSYAMSCMRRNQRYLNR